MNRLHERHARSVPFGKDGKLVEPNSKRMAPAWRRAVFLGFVLGPLAAFVTPACSSSESAAPPPAVPCALNSDCSGGLICAVGVCRVQCRTIADCPKGGSCIDDGMGHGVCQLAAENNRPCDLEVNCDPPLTCASDYRCRNACTLDRDCNIDGISGRVCATDLNGAHYCADPQVPGELNDAGVIVEPPPPLSDGAVPTRPAPPNGDASQPSPDGTTSPDGAGGDASGETDGTSPSGDGQPGPETGAGCDAPCGLGMACVNGGCQVCGTKQGDPCCGRACNSGLSCDSQGMCDCGKPGLSCCGGMGGMCSNNVTCDPAGMCACGQAGQACCPAADAGTAVCAATSTCAGRSCACITSCSGGLTVQKVDGTLWHSSNGAAATKVTMPDNSDLIAGSYSDGVNLGCAVRASDGAVFCWDELGGDNSKGQLGDGTTTPSTTPMQVVTGSGNLTGAKLVAVSSQGDLACAVNATGVWCWGNGSNYELGTGLNSNSQVAIPVHTDSSLTTQFGADVDQLSVADHICARRTDGSAWCWGTNAHGEVGAGTTMMQHPYPVKVGNLMNSVASISVGAMQTCASTTDGSVYCWGYGAYGILGQGTTAMMSNTPVQILSGMAGSAAFTGAAQVTVDFSGSYSNACALKTDRTIWCWGSGIGSMAPTPMTANQFPVDHVFFAGRTSTFYPCWIDQDGALWAGQYKQSTQVTCP
jgi:hypothetical protein